MATTLPLSSEERAEMMRDRGITKEYLEKERAFEEEREKERQRWHRKPKEDRTGFTIFWLEVDYGTNQPRWHVFTNDMQGKAFTIYGKEQFEQLKRHCYNLYIDLVEKVYDAP